MEGCPARYHCRRARSGAAETGQSISDERQPPEGACIARVGAQTSLVRGVCTATLQETQCVWAPPGALLRRVPARCGHNGFSRPGRRPAAVRPHIRSGKSHGSGDPLSGILIAAYVTARCNQWVGASRCEMLPEIRISWTLGDAEVAERAARRGFWKALWFALGAIVSKDGISRRM